MPEIKLRVDDLILDHDNPRISHAEGQQEALQKIVNDQKVKLVKLAESIVNHGLNPMDRLLVLRVNTKPERFIALEGNRRVAVFKLLTNPAVMTGLRMPGSMQSILARLATGFSKSKIEPISCFELESRGDGDYWLQLRHKGEQGGAGIVGWETGAQQRFGTKSPTIQALDMVTERGGLSSEDVAAVANKFPTTTLQRFLEDRKVRKAIGFDVKDGKLVTSLPAPEALKPLKRIVLDLAKKKKKVGDFMTTQQMLDYVGTFAEADAADMSKASDTVRSVEEIPGAEFRKPDRAPRRRPDPSDRKEVIPKTCALYVTGNRVADIYKELRALRLGDAPNSIAVLMRVFLEMSVDHFLESNNSSPSFKTPNGEIRFKKLDKKLAEVVGMMVSIGRPKERYANVLRSLHVETSPMYIDLFHRYVHDRFASPSPAELKAGWDQMQPLLEDIWSS